MEINNIYLPKNITTKNMNLVRHYNFNSTDIQSWINSGRTIPMFIKNRLRAHARGLVIQDLGLIQDEFVECTTASERTSLVHQKMEDLMSKGISKATKINKLSETEKALRRSCTQARVKNEGKTITKETTRNFHTIKVIQDTDELVKEYMDRHGEATHCALTGIKFDDNNPLMRRSLDHTQSISRDGSHTADNLRFVLTFINMGQGNHTDAELAEVLTKLKET